VVVDMMLADERPSNYPGPAPHRSLHWICLRAALSRRRIMMWHKRI
jgi:hypothetical protein